MKKTALIIALMMTGIVAAAQGSTNRFHFSIEAAAGLTHYYNYPTLSLVTDTKESYTAPSMSLSFGIRNESTQFGLRYRQTIVRTSALSLQENATVHDVSLLYQRSVKLTPKVELYVGASTGLTVLQNNLAAVGISSNRFGVNGGVEAGLRYYVSEYNYLSLSAGLDAARFFDSHNRIPDGYDPKTGRVLVGGHGMGGICIGIPPKVKKINMPAALIMEGDGLILAYYE